MTNVNVDPGEQMQELNPLQPHKTFIKLKVSERANQKSQLIQIRKTSPPVKPSASAAVPLPVSKTKLSSIAPPLKSVAAFRTGQ